MGSGYETSKSTIALAKVAHAQGKELNLEDVTSALLLLEKLEERPYLSRARKLMDQFEKRLSE
jgi:hypothetical protein